jgi:YbgC/YbaW family acyl-CoA thioester hydrolase
VKKYKTEIRVRWSETDPEQVVYFANYFTYFAIAEGDFVRSLGLSYRELAENQGINFPRIEAFCQYESPAKYDDLLEVYVWIKDITEKTITFGFEIFRKGEEKRLVNGFIKAICVNKEFKSTKIPEDIFKKFKSAYEN